MNEMTQQFTHRIDTSDEQRCCGCMACMNVCNHKAIHLSINENGFIMPEIDDEKCVDCGMCLRVCDFKKEHESESNIEHAYSLINRDDNCLLNSTSGGAFTAFSEVILNEGGLVVGAVLENDFTVHHVITNNKEGRNRMRGSKYVQSDTSSVYKTIKDAVNEGRYVLFVGTPCQCAAVRSFVGKENERLFIVDFLCHGVPNNELFKDHVKFLETYYKNKICSYSFRGKDYGWDSYNNIVVLDGGLRKVRWINQAYYKWFVSSVSLRPSCHNCVYRSYHRPSDITIADFWGIGKLTKSTPVKGVSLVMTHSKKAHNLIKRCTNVQIKEFSPSSILYRIHIKPAKSETDVNLFWDVYHKGNYELLVSRFFDNSFRKRLKFEIRKIVKLLKFRKALLWDKHETLSNI